MVFHSSLPPSLYPSLPPFLSQALYILLQYLLFHLLCYSLTLPFFSSFPPPPVQMPRPPRILRVPKRSVPHANDASPSATTSSAPAIARESITRQCARSVRTGVSWCLSNSGRTLPRRGTAMRVGRSTFRTGLLGVPGLSSAGLISLRRPSRRRLVRGVTAGCWRRSGAAWLCLVIGVSPVMAPLLTTFAPAGFGQRRRLLSNTPECLACIVSN